MITARSLTKKFGTFTAVDNLSFSIKKGEIIGFLGPNGAGKTTTMRILTTFFGASSGEVSLDKHDAFDNPLLVRQSIGYLPESAPLYMDMKVIEYLSFMAEMRGVQSSEIPKRIKKVAEETGLTERLNQLIGQLSKGYRQRVGLAQTLVHDPEILILDEPTTGLDPHQIIEIRQLIKTIGKTKTIILSTHILSEAEATCDRIIIINNGKLAASGSLEEIRKTQGDKEILTLTLEGKTTGIEKLLKSIEGVIQVSLSDQAVEKGTTVLHLECSEKPELRKEITQKIINADYDLVGISKESQSLEQLFIDLTQ